jgi:subfamily B ATP-binding cassette protein MsbA
VTRSRDGSLESYRRLLRYAWPYKWAIAFSWVGATGMAMTATAFVALMKPFVDEGLVARDPEVVRLVPLYLIAIFALRGVSNFVSEYMLKWAGRKVVFDLRNAVFAHMMYLPCSFYDVNASGKLVAKLLYDVEQLSRATTNAVLVLTRDGFTAIGIFAWMLYLNWKLTLLLAALAPITGLVVRAMAYRMRKLSRSIQQSMGDISLVAQEATEGQKVVKAFAGQHAEIKSFTKVNDKNRRQVMRRVAVSVAGVSVTLLMAACAIALVLYIAVQSGQASAGTFVSYASAMMWLMAPMRRVVQVNELVQTGIAAAQSAFTVLDESPEPEGGTRTLDSVSGRVEYRDVSFRYPAAAEDALRHVSFALEPGKTLALVGASGSGKTTVANLLPRFYTVTGGEILMDDVNINELTLTNLRSHIATVSQETMLFDDTIRKNIAYGSPGPVDNDKVEQAAEAAHVTEFIDKLSDGLDTMVGEKGLRLSGGQRQRIAIARALYKDAPILILDEATSALDSESERAVQAALEALLRNRSTLVIAHRLATIENADRIVVLSRGRVAEQGTHAELLAAKGVYADLHRLQFSEQPN